MVPAANLASPQPVLLVVMGPTASGKTTFAESVAAKIDAHLINGDAFQIYRGMDIGTGKSENKHRYSLIDIRDPNEAFGVGEFVRIAAEILEDHFKRGQNVVLVGGTGLYIRALIDGYEDLHEEPPAEIRNFVNQLHEKEGFDAVLKKLTELGGQFPETLDLKNPIRVKRALEKVLHPTAPMQVSIPPYLIKKVAILPTIEQTRINIVTRVSQMMQNNWVAEVRELLESGFCSNDPGFRAIGYRTIVEHLNKNLSQDEVVSRVTLDTIRYAKRQRTWLRKEPSLKIVGTLSEGLHWAENTIIYSE